MFFVAQTGCLLYRRLATGGAPGFAGIRNIRHRADCQSAKQQVDNLRYEEFVVRLCDSGVCNFPESQPPVTRPEILSVKSVKSAVKLRP